MSARKEEREKARKKLERNEIRSTWWTTNGAVILFFFRHRHVARSKRTRCHFRWIRERERERRKRKKSLSVMHKQFTTVRRYAFSSFSHQHHHHRNFFAFHICLIRKQDITCLSRPFSLYTHMHTTSYAICFVTHAISHASTNSLQIFLSSFRFFSSSSSFFFLLFW